MRLIVPCTLGAVLLWTSGTGAPAAHPSSWTEAELPHFVVSEAPFLQMPGVAVPERNLDHEVDSNSPLHWDGDTLYAFNSYSHPWCSSGSGLAYVAGSLPTRLGALNDKLEIWHEATWKDDQGPLYGAYHCKLLNYAINTRLDGDGWNFHRYYYRKLFDGPKHGVIPIGWQVTPTALDGIPDIIDYYYRHARPGDYFVNALTGLGYIHEDDYASAWPPEELVHFDGHE